MTTPATTTRTLGDVTIPQAGRFALDPAHTAVGFVVRHLVVSKVRGSFGEVSGVITLAEEPLESAVEVTIVRRQHQHRRARPRRPPRSSDFLDLENHPNITFRSTKVTQRKGAEFIIVGDLTIRDVTREVELAGRVRRHRDQPVGPGGRRLHRDD